MIALEVKFKADEIVLRPLICYIYYRLFSEARIEERYARLAQGQATSHGTQYERHGLSSFATKVIVPTEENKPAMTITRKEISLTLIKDESNYQDYRTQKEALIPKSGNTGGLKEVMEKNVTTLPCSVRIKLEKPTDVTTDTAIYAKDNNISNTSKQILANIVFPMPEILQDSEVTASSEGITHQFKEKNGIKICHSNSQDLDDKMFPKFIDNSSLQSNEIVTSIIEVITNEFSETSQRTEEPIFEIESEGEKTKHMIISKASTKYSNIELETPPETSQKNYKSPLLSRQALPQEQNAASKSSNFLGTEKSQVAVEKLSQQTSISSLIKSLSSAKATNTQESTPPNEYKKNDNHPTTTIGLVMLDVFQKVGNSLFHNTNHFINENKHKVTNVTLADSNVKTTENDFPMKSTNLDTKNSDTNNATFTKDVTVKNTSSDADPQTSKLKKKQRKKLPTSSGYSSKAMYTRNLKSFWEIFLNYRRT